MQPSRNILLWLRQVDIHHQTHNLRLQYIILQLVQQERISINTD
uniref:Uncharacterized protein n=1 Tax=Anguilla anguilla TaxID=7936 RepID=A0A0E9U279_ANGAN